MAGRSDPMLYEWRSSYYDRDTYTEQLRTAERQRRVNLGQFVMQRDAPGGAKQFRAFSNMDDAFDFIVGCQLDERTFYETVFDVHARQKPHFDIDIVPTAEDPMDHVELLNRLLTEIKRVVGPDLDLVDDIGVYSSHSDDASKRSYHVVLTGYHVLDNVEAGNFAKAVRDGMVAATDGPESPEAVFITKCVDLLVYKKLQQFRLLGCTKLGRNRHKSLVLEYSAAGRTRRRGPMVDPRVEFRNSLLSLVGETSKYLDPKCYWRPVDPATIGTTVVSLTDADALLRALCSKSREAAFSAMSGAIEVESLWIKDSTEIVAHLIDASHLPSDLASSCRAHTQTTNSRGALIALRSPPAGGYWCVLCERRHDNENPYLTLHEERRSEAATLECPRVVSIIYRCRRDPMSSMRLCSMRGGGVSGMASFTCIDEPYDPRQGEKFVRGDASGSAAIDM